VKFLKKELKGQCPCGYGFYTFNDKKAAIVGVRLHFERFHKDFLPFGITNAEALSLIKQGRVHRKQKVSSSNFSNLKQNSPIPQ